MRQALDLVADTLYAMILPSKGINSLVVGVSIKDLGEDNEYTLGRGGGDFHNTGDLAGFPVSGEVRIEINSNILEDRNEDDHPRYLSALNDWYLLFLHESLHVLGFGISPKWESLKTKKRHDYFICGREVYSWTGHWGGSTDFDNVALMRWSIWPWNTIIAPETFCVLERIGWTLRPKGQASSSAATTAPAKPANLQVGSITDTSVRVSWDASDGATDYDVSYKTASGGEWTTSSHRGIALHNAIDGLEPNTEYRWAVKADNDAGKSDWAFGPNFTTKQE